MFRKKEPPPPTLAPSGPNTWSKPSAMSQEFWVVVHSWQFKVFPSRRAQSFGTFMFQLEGRCATPPLKDVTVAADVEVLEPGDHLGMLEDHWQTVPKDYEGFVHFSDDWDNPLLGMTLFCKASALDSLHKAFSIGASAREGGVGVKVVVDCPNNKGGDFWQLQWRKEWLRVVSWSVFAGAQMEAPGVA